MSHPAESRVILYYLFTPVIDPARMVEDQRRLCSSLELRGRIYIASEGINGTLAGRVDGIEAYKKRLRTITGFEAVEFKEESCFEIPFAHLRVKERREIVALHYPEPLDPRTEGGRHLSPAEWRRVLESSEDYVLLDVRNNYESGIGHFEGAIRPDVSNFYEFPRWLEQAGIDKDKKVLMYCTGGIRCEKFSVLLKKQGYSDVNQLHGGILNYARQEQGRHFLGKCFVFDDRLSVPVNPSHQETLSCCAITGEPCDRYVNCANMDCNKLFVCSEKGAEIMEGCCSEACRSHPNRRPYVAGETYRPFRKRHHYFGNSPKQKA